MQVVQFLISSVLHFSYKPTSNKCILCLYWRFSSYLTENSFTTPFTVSSLSPRHLLGIHQAQTLTLSFFCIYTHSINSQTQVSKYILFITINLHLTIRSNNSLHLLLELIYSDLKWLNSWPSSPNSSTFSPPNLIFPQSHSTLKTTCLIAQAKTLVSLTQSLSLMIHPTSSDLISLFSKTFKILSLF